MYYPSYRMRRLRRTPAIRDLVRETKLQLDDLVYPLFVIAGENIKNPISSMPGCYQLSIGNVLPDQLQFMLQVGFDAFEIGDRFPLETWQKASRQMSLAYQRGLFRRGSEAEIWTERHTDAEPWLEQPHAG